MKITSIFILLLGLLILSGNVMAAQIDVLCWSGEVSAAIRDLSKEYMEQFPDQEIRVTEFDYATAEQRMWLDYASGAGMYDGVIMLSSWFPRANAEGYLVPLNDYINNDPELSNFWDDYSDGLLAPYKDEETLYGIPVHDGPMMLYYRKDLIEDASEATKAKFKAEFGYEPGVPGTWDELIDMAKFFSDKDNGLYGIATTAKEEAGLGDRVLQFLHSYGEKLFDKNWNPVLDKSEAIHDYFNFMREALSTASEGAIAQDGDEMAMHFLAGRDVFLIQWTDVGARVYDPKQSSLDPEQVGYAMVPKGKGENARYAPFFLEWASTISKNSDNPDETFQFFSWLSRHDREMLSLGAIACRESTLTDPDILESQPYLKTAAISHKYVMSVPPVTVSTQVRLALARMASGVLSGGMEEDEAIQNTQNKLAKIMKEAGYIK